MQASWTEAKILNYSYKSQPNAINQTAGNLAVLTGKLVGTAG